MARIKMHIPKEKLPFYPPCEVKCRLQNGVSTRMPNEILKHRINYKYMAIETDKHVKIMFDKLERIPEVINIELYI